MVSHADHSFERNLFKIPNETSFIQFKYKMAATESQSGPLLSHAPNIPTDGSQKISFIYLSY